MKKLMISNLKINNFRCLQNINLNFNENYNEITGRNELGKTTILDAIRYLLFNSNDKNSKANNLNTIATNEKNGDILPNIEGTFINGQDEFNLKIKNGKYYFNDIEQKNSTTYLEMISNNLNLENIQDLTEFLHYIKLQETMCSDKTSQDKNNLINLLISLVNDKLNNSEKIDPYKLDDIVSEIEHCENEIKQLKKDMKIVQEQKEQIKIHHPNIKNWDEIGRIDEQQIYELRNKINEYKSIETNIVNYIDELQQLKVDEHNINEKIDNIQNNVHENKNPKKKNKFVTIFLTIITFGLYLIFRNKNSHLSHGDTVTSNLRNFEEQRKNIVIKRREINIEIESAKKDPHYHNVNIESLKNELHEHENYNSNEDIINNTKAKYKRYVGEINEYEKLLNQKNDNLILLKNENVKNIEKIDGQLSKFFNKYSVKLTNNSTNGKLNIYYNGIDFKYLNYAAKTNITLSISNFLKQKNDLQIFDLLDQRESINDLLNETNNQIIACKVTEDNQLKLNGKNIY